MLLGEIAYSDCQLVHCVTVRMRVLVTCDRFSPTRCIVIYIDTRRVKLLRKLRAGHFHSTFIDFVSVLTEREGEREKQ